MTFPRNRNRPDATQLVNPFGLNQAILMGLASGLPGVTPSIQRMEKALTEPYGVFAEFDFLVLDNLTQNGNRTLLVNRLNSLAEASQIQEFESLFLFFSGHAAMAPDYRILLPERSLPKAQQSEDRDWLGWSTLLEWVVPIRAKQVMIVLDTCFASSLHSVDTLRWLQKFDEEEPGQKILIASGSKDEVAWAAGENCFLTEAMVEALEGWGARTDRGVVTSDQLFSFLRRRVPELSQRKSGLRAAPYRLFWPERPKQPMALSTPRQRVELDDSLKDAVLERRCLLWTGEHLNERSIPSSFPSRLQWEGLERKVWLEYADFQREPGEASIQLASFGLSILDSGVDSSVAEACKQVDLERWVPTATDTVPEHKPPLAVRLSGAIGNLDYVYEWEDLNTRFQVFYDWFVETRWWDTILIMGFPLDEPIPRQWLAQLIRLIPNVWMVFPQGDEHDRAQQLRDMGVKLILMDDLEVIKQLKGLSRIEVDVVRTNQVRAPLPKKKAPEPAPYSSTHNPFPGLVPFQEKDETHFFGRSGAQGQSGDLHALREDVHLHRKVLFYGETGVGKTSLLKAGLLPVLSDVDGFRVLYTDAADPLSDLAQQISHESCFAHSPTSTNVLERIGFLSESTGDTVVICMDHLERALHSEPAVRDEDEPPYLDRLERALLSLEEAWPTGNWRLVLTVRKESYVMLREMVKLGDSPASQPFQHREIGLLTKSMARQAILSPLPQGVTMEENLLHKLLLELRETGPRETPLYHPARLQLVLHSIYQHALKQGAKRLSLAHYKAAPNSLTDWVKQRWTQDVFSSFSRAEALAAQDMLVLLVNSKGVRRLLAWPALRERLSVRHKPKHVESARKGLVSAGVLREREMFGMKRVEISHDFWVPPCQELRSQASVLANEAFELLHQHEGRLLAILPKQATRNLNTRVGLWEQIPYEHSDALRKFHDESVQFYRKRWMTQAGIVMLLVLILGVAGFLFLPASIESLVDRQTDTFLKETSSQQSKFWIAINYFKKPKVQAIARLRLTQRLLSSKGQESCKILRALYHTSGGNVADSVKASTGSQGVYLVHGLECPSDTQLQKIVLRGAVLRSAKLPRATLHGADLKGVDLQEAILTQAKLRGANLTEVDLQKAQLKGADLSEAKLEKARLQWTDLRGASFQGASMFGVKLTGAILDAKDIEPLVQAGASLTGAICLTRGDATTFNGTAGPCYRWHLGERKEAKPALCPSKLEGPILSFGRLAKDGTCPPIILQRIAMSSAYCPKPGHPACKEGAACQNNNIPACYKLARRYETGKGVQVDLYTSALFYRKSCKTGHAPSCYALGTYFLYGRGMERHEKSAANLFERVCKMEHGPGCADLASLLEKGWGTTQNNKRAQRLYQKACDKDVASGCVGLGHFYEVGLEVRQNLKRAASLYAKACLAGRGTGCYRGARLMWRNKKQRAAATALYQKSRRYLQQACNRDEAESCAFLGILHEKGWGGKKDLKAAKDLYNKACQLGHGLGCNSLGSLFFEGKVVKKSLPTALLLFRKSCGRNSGEGCDNLGSMYERAKGVKKNLRQARTFYLKACNHNYGWGCNDLGDLYNLGRGVRRSRSRARKWYRRACKLGVSSACR